MKGKLIFAKFPVGLYYCQCEDVKAGVTGGGKDIIVIHWRVQSGPKKGELVKERMNSVSSNFLKGIGEPSEFGCEWDTNDWRGKFCWVDVKYSPDEQQWQRFGHHQTPPPGEQAPPPEEEPPLIPPPAKVGADDIPF